MISEKTYAGVRTRFSALDSGSPSVRRLIRGGVLLEQGDRSGGGL